MGINKTLRKYKEFYIISEKPAQIEDERTVRKTDVLFYYEQSTQKYESLVEQKREQQNFLAQNNIVPS